MKPDLILGEVVPRHYRTKAATRCRGRHRSCPVSGYSEPSSGAYKPLDPDQEKTVAGAKTLNVLPLFYRGNAPFCMQQVAQIPPSASSPAPGGDIQLNTPETKVLFFSDFGAPVHATLIFQVIGPPTVTSVAPSNGSAAGNVSVKIVGTNFMASATVTVGGVPATYIKFVNATELDVILGPHNPGKVDVVVTTPAGPETGAGLFTYQ
jgi:hypothetical protein